MKSFLKTWKKDWMCCGRYPYFTVPNGSKGTSWKAVMPQKSRSRPAIASNISENGWIGPKSVSLQIKASSYSRSFS